MIATWAFGELVYDPSDEVWLGFVRLPHFEPHASAVPPPAETVEEILTQIEQRSRKLKLADEPPPTAQQHFENWGDLRPSRRDIQERGLDRWLDKLQRVRRAEGLTGVRLASPDREPLRPIQEATVRHLITNGATIRDAVFAAMTRSSTDYGPDEETVARAKVCAITVHGDGLDGLAPIVFGIDCEWEQEHGIEVVYHPRIGAEWGSCGDTDFTAALPEFPPPPPPTPAEELVAAIYAGDAGQTQALLAAGARAYGGALYHAIRERTVELVRQLLAAGADPNHRDGFEGTPLEAARRALAEGTLTLPRRAPWWLRLLVLVPKLVNAGHVRREGRNGRTVLRLLIDAGAK